MRVKFAVFLMLTLLVVTAMNSTASAQPADTACDPEYMDSLEARSWLLGTRRVSMNNNLIIKPDSVIEYSCLNESMDVMAAAPYRQLGSRTYHDQTFTNIHMLFSESDYWGSISGFTQFTLDDAIVNLVVSSMVNYLNDNYMHYYLGMRVTSGPAGPISVSGVFDCVSISYIWHVARCMEFMDEDTLDGFYDFPFYRTFDPRQLPPDFGVCQISTTDRTDHLNEAYRGGINYMLYTHQLDFGPILGGPYDEDPIVPLAHLDRVLPGTCSNSPMIPTGITIERVDAAGTYPEFFCVMPGCAYDGAGACVP